MGTIEYDKLNDECKEYYDYLKQRYNINTVNQYTQALSYYMSKGYSFVDQDSINTFIAEKRNKYTKKLNPFYSGFITSSYYNYSSRTFFIASLNRLLLFFFY